MEAVETKNKNSDNPKKSTPPVSILRYTDIAFRMGATIMLGTWIGKWLDGKMGFTKPIFLPILAMVAITGAIYMVIRDANKI
jgi:F0F1-type ATP synthase assembly protein I